ncbi:MAG: hypothetical protein BalsKO_17150 [Balneolaceae bacterium]
MIKQFLNIEVIWKDEHMFELKINCSNGRYSGTTEVYDTKESLLPFANSLKGYPFQGGELQYECGKEDNYAYFKMKFYQIKTTGIVGVQINVEENVPTEYRKEEKDKLKMELIVEPNAIDSFQKELLNLAMKESGSANLIGIKPYTNNIK